MKSCQTKSILVDSFIDLQGPEVISRSSKMATDAGEIRHSQDFEQQVAIKPYLSLKFEDNIAILAKYRPGEVPSKLSLKPQ